MKKWLRFALLFAVAITGGFCNAQDLFKGTDLSQLKVDQLSDADIVKFNNQLQSSGLTLGQAEQLALSKGMQASEIAKLKQRVQILGATKLGNNTIAGESVETRVDNNMPVSEPDRKRSPVINPDIFGAELFNNESLDFKANYQIATPVNYELGPGDELQLAIYGVQEMSTSVAVSAEGVINIPNVGLLKIAGSTIEAATSRIRAAMSAAAYPTLKTGGSKLSVTLGNKIRSIHITVIGANKPGNYILSSLSTTFNALYMAGGPSAIGSFREIELIREGKVERVIDLYSFLAKGSQKDNVRLRDNDVIRIPAYRKRVEIRGQVKRSGIFELLDNENFSALLNFASGFTDTAYKSSVKLIQLTENDKRIIDLSAQQYSSYLPRSGDVITVAAILDKFQNRVNISGAVFRPGYYELTHGMTIAELISKADGLKQDAFTARAQLIRLRNDLTKEIITFNVQSVLDKGSDNIVLQRDDELVITSIFDLRNEHKVSIQGEIRVPGDYLYIDSLSLKDLVMLAGGFTDAAKPQKIEISRMLIRDTLTAFDERSSEVIEVTNSQELSNMENNIRLMPFDVVTIRRKPGYQPLASVNLSGQVQYPGPYVVSRRSERVSDLIKRAGGFTPEAYIEGAYLRRFLDEKEARLKKERVSRLQENIADSSSIVLEDIERQYDQIPLDIQTILREPGSVSDLVVRASDEIYIPKFDAQVRISGGVLMPTQIPFTGRFKVKDYLLAAGGVSQDALKRKIYVLYANGRASSTRNFLFFKNYPEVKPGAEVVVPKKIPKLHRSSGEIIGFASVLASLAGVIIAIINVTK
ncbi:protein involved in polysaccharide export with SLBB domain [Filimonas zeae]|uniref:Capsule polysaccharide transporter n=1 Tax=Filimonas zeae TaxID=1737353 RepID=A0A917J3D0_9BACT|nr:SLBB domain-containing protein [Filimonas zeae]MDR6341813.1 protein involved in polysaccharide export with SLBB domain [Filimonas zeae]GGH80231.1 capsule polysaccharide transporter [Filimonas zeae]